MKTAKIPFLIFFAGCIVLFLGVSLTPPKSVQAQCSNPSSCKTCHETNGQDPINSVGIWHTQHAVFDYCTACHGGNRDAADEATAHQGMVVQLSGMSGTCVNCHASDVNDRLKTYTAVLGVNVTAPTPGALCTPTPDVFGMNQALPLPTEKPGGSTIPAGMPAEKKTNPTGNLILTGLLIVLVAGGGTYIFQNEKRLRSNLPETDRKGASRSTPAAEVEEIIPELEQLTPEGLNALKKLVQDPRRASELFEQMEKDNP